jgi:hypothetical protein
MSGNDKVEALFEQALKFKAEERAAFLAGPCERMSPGASGWRNCFGLL